MADYMNRVNGFDAEVATYESSKLIVNLLSTYFKTYTEDPLSDESMGGLVQGLRCLYDEAGHRGPWTEDEDLTTVKGDALHRNTDIDKLRSAHRVRLARVGKAKISPRPLQVGHVAERTKEFWLDCNNLRDYPDVLLYGIMVVGLSQGLRYEQIHKLTIGIVTVVPGTSGEGRL